MWELIAIGLLAGMITGLSPCVLPVLPVIFFAGGTARSASRGTGRLLRPGLIIFGLVSSFSVLTLLGSALLAAIGLPADFLRWAGLVVLVSVGLGVLFPPLARVLERPLQVLPRVVTPTVSGGRSGRFGGSAFILGLGVGTLYVPCAGPVLAAISIAGTSRHLTGSIIVLTVAFSVGVAVPLFFFALAGVQISRRLSAYRRRRNAFRIVGGLVMVVLAFALTFNLTDALQRAVPSYTQALQNGVEDNTAARAALAGLNESDPHPKRSSVGPSAPVTGSAVAPEITAVAAGSTILSSVASPAQQVAPPATGPVVTCLSHASTLANCGPAPQIIGIQAWLNTPQNHPLTLMQLRGKVVLVNFWTFSCINCQRTLPYLKAWYAAYHASGLEIIAVHTPEFSFEHDLGNVRDAVASDGINYPVALDNASATWQNYRNSYWPAEYLTDAQGIIRHLVAGEGGYADSERLIRQLLRAANPANRLPAPTDPAVPAG